MPARPVTDPSHSGRAAERARTLLLQLHTPIPDLLLSATVAVFSLSQVSPVLKPYLTHVAVQLVNFLIESRYS